MFLSGLMPSSYGKQQLAGVLELPRTKELLIRKSVALPLHNNAPNTWFRRAEELPLFIQQQGSPW